MSTPETYPLTVSAVEPQIGGAAVSISFDVPAEWRSAFQWWPGQFLTVFADVGDETLRRCYTISASPYSGDPLRITVKRVQGGRVSQHLNDHAQVGDTFQVLPPAGKFTLEPVESEHRTHYFIGAGSGITPLFAMAQSVLLAEPWSTAHLLYANHNHKSIIFLDALQQLADQHHERFSLRHVFSHPASWTGFAPWRKGRIDRAALAAFFAAHPPYAQNAHYYLCGPGSMNTDLRQALAGLDVPKDRIHSESFGGAGATPPAAGGIAATAQMHLEGNQHEVPIAAGQTLLTAARAAGLKPSFSCESGVCGSCRAHLREGTVAMPNHPALDENEVAGGAILTCQARATSAKLKVDF